MLDYLAVKCLHANKIFEFWQEVEKSADKGKAVSSFNMEVVSTYHTRIFDMQDFIAETKAMFRQAWLSEYIPFRPEIALRKYDMEMNFRIKLQRKFEKICSNYDPGKSFRNGNQ